MVLQQVSNSKYLKTCQNGNLILINQVKLYKDKRLQGFCYQGLPRKQIPFVKHYLLSDLQKEKTILTNYLQTIFWTDKYQ